MTSASLPSINAIITLMALLLSGANTGVQSFAPMQPFPHGRSTMASTEFSQNAFAPSNQHIYTSHPNIQTFKRYSEAVDRPMPSNFEERMRKLALGNTKPKTRRANNPQRPTNVQEVSTLEEYKEAVSNAKLDNKLVVVRFYAKWCRACRAVAPSFYRLAKEFSEEADFVEVPITANNANLHQGLGVPSIPFGHIYHPQGGLVEELRMIRKEFPRFEKTFQNYVNEQCDLPSDGDCSNPHEQVEISMV